MSYAVVKMVYESTLPHLARTFCAYLATYANDDGSSVFPSQARMACEYGVTDRTVRTRLKELEDMGVIIPVSHDGGGSSSVRYRIDLAKLTPEILSTPETLRTYPGSLLPPTPEILGSDPGSLLPPTPEAGFLRSVSDPSLDPSLIRHDPSLRTELEEIMNELRTVDHSSNDPDYRRYRSNLWERAEELSRAFDITEHRISDDSEKYSLDHPTKVIALVR